MCAELPRRVPAGGIGSLPAVLPAGAGAALGVHRTGEAAPPRIHGPGRHDVLALLEASRTPLLTGIDAEHALAL